MTDAPKAERERCRFVSRCPMFPVFTNSSVLRIYQIRYCEGRFNECKRFESASQGVMPPPTLLPDGDLLEEHSAEPGSLSIRGT